MAKNVSEQLREALQQSGWTPSTIGRAAGVSPGIIHRFLSGERGLALDTIDRICEVLALELMPSQTKKPQELVNYPPGRRKRDWEQMERERAARQLDLPYEPEEGQRGVGATLKGDERTVIDGKVVTRNPAKRPERTHEEDGDRVVGIRKAAKGMVDEPEEIEDQVE